MISRIVQNKGYYVFLTIFSYIRPEHRLTQEEIFEPVLSIMKAKNFDEAIDMANSTKFALTGGVFSRSPKHLEQARRDLKWATCISTGALPAPWWNASRSEGSRCRVLAQRRVGPIIFSSSWIPAWSQKTPCDAGLHL